MKKRYYILSVVIVLAIWTLNCWSEEPTKPRVFKEHVGVFTQAAIISYNNGYFSSGTVENKETPYDHIYLRLHKDEGFIITEGIEATTLTLYIRTDEAYAIIKTLMETLKKIPPDELTRLKVGEIWWWRKEGRQK